jgi:hypothetical protein
MLCRRLVFEQQKQQQQQSCCRPSAQLLFSHLLIGCCPAMLALVLMLQVDFVNSACIGNYVQYDGGCVKGERLGQFAALNSSFLSNWVR